MVVVLDTSVLIEELRGGFGDFRVLMNQFALGDLELLVPIVVLVELWAGKSTNHPDVGTKIMKLYEPLQLVELTEEIAVMAGTYRRDFGLSAMDAVIAATTLVEKAQLATLNSKDFSRVPGVKIWRG
jgi:predicted nucleic acid-binding protein